VFTDEKKLLKKSNVSYIHVPYYEEISVKRLWVDLKQDKDFNVFFQDDYPKDKTPNHDYFFNILNSVHP